MKKARNGAIQFDARDIALAFGDRPPTKCANCAHESPEHRIDGGTTFDLGACQGQDGRTKTGHCKCSQFVDRSPLTPDEEAAADEGALALLEVIVGMPIGSSKTPEGQAWLNGQIASTTSSSKGS